MQCKAIDAGSADQTGHLTEVKDYEGKREKRERKHTSAAPSEINFRVVRAVIKLVWNAIMLRAMKRELPVNLYDPPPSIVAEEPLGFSMLIIYNESVIGVSENQDITE